MTPKTASFSWVAVAVGVGLAAPASAAALDPGVNYDPGSPAGKEYVIPLVGGRSDGAGTTDQQRGANVPFGVGIRPPGSRSGQGGGAGSAAPGTAPGPDNTTGSGDGRSSAAEQGGGAINRGDLRSRIEGAEDVGGTGGQTLLIVLAVLLPAALLAVLLQRRRHLSRGGRAA